MTGQVHSNMMKRYLILWGSLFALFLLLVAPVQAQGTATIDFTANVTSGTPPLSVLFIDTSTIPVIEDFRRWDFGDGTVVLDPAGAVEHTYFQEGIFTVRLDRSDSEGYHSLIKYNYITVGSPTPTPTPTLTTVPTTSPTTTATTVAPTTTLTTGPTTSPTTAPTTQPTTQPTVQIPSEFFGQATVSAQPVPSGSLISARIGTRNAGEIVIATPGEYGGSGPFDQRLKVYATNDEIGSGPVVITFWLDGTVQACQTAYFQSGTAQNLALTFAGTTPTPTTTPTTSPTTTATTYITTTPTTSPITTVPTTNPTTAPTTQPTVTPTGTPGLTLTCERGWNHISIPRILAPGADTGTIFSPIDTEGHSIWRYNGTLQRYDRIYPGTHLSPTDSIWVYSSSHTTLPLYFAGQQGLVERNLFTGWNGFGITNLTSVPARDALSPVSWSWEYAYGFDPLLQMYEVSIVKGGMGTHNDTRLLIAGEGYWLHMGENATFRAFVPDI